MLFGDGPDYLSKYHISKRNLVGCKCHRNHGTRLLHILAIVETGYAGPVTD